METKKKVHGDKVTRDKGENDDCQGKDAWSAARHIFIKGDRVYWNTSKQISVYAKTLPGTFFLYLFI